MGKAEEWEPGLSCQFEAFVLFGQIAVWFSYMSACAAIFGG